MTPHPGQARFSWAGFNGKTLLVAAIGLLSACETQDPIPASPESVSPQVLRLIADSCQPTTDGTASVDPAANEPCTQEVVDPDVERLLEQAKVLEGSGSLDSLSQKIQELAQAQQVAGRWCSRATLLGVLGDLWANREPPRAVKYYEQALDSAYRAGSPRRVAGLLNDLGLLEGRRQRLSRALEHLAGARQLWRHLDANAEWANSHLNAGGVYLRMGRLQAARRTLDQACDRLQQLGAANTRRLAICLTWKGRLLGELGEKDLAFEVLEEAMALRRSASLAQTPGLDALGGLHLSVGRFERASELFESAVAASRNPVDRANATANWADAQLRLGRLDRAIELSRRSEHLAAQAGLGDPNLTLHNLHVQAQAFYGLGHWRALDGTLEWILGTFESLRTQGQGELLLPFFARRRHILDHFVLSLASRGRSGEAFEVAESVRARSLLDHLVWPLDEIRASADVESVKELDGTRRELSAALGDLKQKLREQAENRSGSGSQAQLGDLGSLESSVVDQAVSRAAALRLRLASVEAEMRGQSGTEGAVALDLESTQRLLGPDTLMLVYWLGGERSLLWSVEHDDFRLYDGLPPKEVLESSIAVWRRYLVKGAEAGSDRESEALSEVLLGPVVDRLWRDRPLILVVEGALASVPFSALPKPGSGGKPMVRDHPISYAYSVSTVAAIRARAGERSTRQSRLISVVADPVYGFDDPRIPSTARKRVDDARERRVSESDALPLGRLAASGLEAEAIGRSGGVVPRTGLAATKEWVLSGALAGSRFVHFGAHARIEAEAPDLSAIELTRIDSGGLPVDGSLRLGDLHGLSLSAELVSLAACDSALGKDVVGEGTMALPRGFLKSGAGAVVASLWAVSDVPASDLMIELYRQLIHLGSAPDQALRAAQLSLLEAGTWADPVHWAGFVLIGDGSKRNSASTRTFSTQRFLPSAKPMERPSLRR